MQKETSQLKQEVEDGENLFIKYFVNIILVNITKVVYGSIKLFKADVPSNKLHEKAMICYLKQIRCTVCQENPFVNGH